MALTPRDYRTLVLICTLDALVLVTLLVLAWATPYDLRLEHIAMVGCWWVGAVMSYLYQRRLQLRHP